LFGYNVSNVELLCLTSILN